MKKIIVFLSLLIVPIAAKAQNCSTTQSWISYRDSNSSWVSSQQTSSLTYNGFAKGVRFAGVNGNIQNKSFIYTGKFNVEFNNEVIMDDVPSLIIELRDNSNGVQDITSSCYVSKKKWCQSDGDGFCYHPYSFDYSVICNAKSNLANARNINFIAHFNDIESLDYTYTTKFERLLDCLVITPSDKEEIITNNDSNTQEILDQNYNYYNSLLEYMNGFENRQSEFISEWGEILENAMTRNRNQIIANQESNTTEIIDSQKVCTLIDKNKVIENNKLITNLGTVANTTSETGITDYISISSQATMYYFNGYTSAYANICFYNINKTKISCFLNNTSLNDTYITIPTDASYFRATIHTGNDKPTLKICQNGNQAISDILNKEGNQNGIGGLNMNNTNSTLNKESQLMNNTFNPNTINITYDQTAWSWVFTQLTNILNANSLIMGMVITILSIGIIKTVMGR